MPEKSAELSKNTFNTLADYEKWVAQDWVYAPGSKEAQLHTRSKLDEEVKEFEDALEEDIPENIKSELGDVMWSATATALNAGFSLEGAFRQGTVSRYFEDGPITIDEVDSLALDFYQTKDVGELSTLLRSFSLSLGKAAKIMHAVRPSLDNLEGQESNVAAFTEIFYGGDIIEDLSHIILISSALAQSCLRVSLSEVMQANYDKLSARLADGKPVTK